MSIKRWTLCVMRGHRWVRTPYPGSEGAADAYFVRCRSCGHENHNGPAVRPTGVGM